MKKNQYPARGDKQPPVIPVTKRKVKDTTEKLQALVEKLESIVNRIPPGVPLFIPDKTQKVFQANESMMNALPEKVRIATVKGVKEGTDVYVKEYRRLVKGYCLAIAVAAFILGFAVCMSLMR